ncbi:hypothetical protein QJS10_CPA01g02359 [Acorus calamus]|uniref:EF-hand domain-containing protein n=1 Tax=Acorus calamus TaxID=4465 RepID=A0AAV9FLQ8_ACOCL|nr:hypothetical protein QJS10_CPA01g02359 [Acorus calamus]
MGGGIQEKKKVAVYDGSDIRELVGDERAFTSFVDDKFSELDRDRDGKLSVKELEPAVSAIGASLGLPAPGSSPDSDHIYHEVLNEFTHGKQEQVSKTEFKEVLSDILLGMAAGLNRDPIVILRIDGEDLREFVDGSSFEMEAISIFSRMESSGMSLRHCIIKALEQLTVEHGIPPSNDSWVLNNIVEPTLQSVANDQYEQPASQDIFLSEFRKVVENIILRLKEHPVIVAHSGNTFDGSGIKRLLMNKFELEKVLDAAWKGLPKIDSQKAPRGYLRVALDEVAPSAGLPPFGSLSQMDTVVNEVFKMVNADEGKIVEEAEFKKTMTEILGSIVLQLEGKPIVFSSSSVVHEPLASSTTDTLLPIPSTESSSRSE